MHQTHSEDLMIDAYFMKRPVRFGVGSICSDSHDSGFGLGLLTQGGLSLLNNLYARDLRGESEGSQRERRNGREREWRDKGQEGKREVGREVDRWSVPAAEGFGGAASQSAGRPVELISHAPLVTRARTLLFIHGHLLPPLAPPHT